MNIITRSFNYIYNHNNFLVLLVTIAVVGSTVMYYLSGNFTFYEKKSDGSEFIGYKHDLEYAVLPMITGLDYNLVRERKPERVAEITASNIDKIRIMAQNGSISYESEKDIAIGNYVGGFAEPRHFLQPNGSEKLVFHGIYKRNNKTYKLSKYNE